MKALSTTREPERQGLAMGDGDGGLGLLEWVKLGWPVTTVLFEFRPLSHKR